MRKCLPLSILLLLILPSSPVADCSEEKVLRVRDGRVITFDQMIDDLKNVPAVLVGEVHDIPEHHEAQLNIVRAIRKSGTPVAIGLEMFRAENQNKLNEWVRGEISTERFLPFYNENWGLSWPLYQDIFLYARQHGIPLVGLNIPRSISEKIAKQGFKSLTAYERKQLPPGINCNVDPAYREFIKRAYAEHAARLDGAFVNFCEAQMVWDKAMAWNAARYLERNREKTMVVLAGIGHAWKRGIPEQLPASDDSAPAYRVVLPSIPNQTSSERITIEDADYILLPD